MTAEFDKETIALQECVRVLSELNPSELRRVFQYLHVRFLDQLALEREFIGRQINDLIAKQRTNQEQQ